MSASSLLFPNQYRRKVLALLLMNPQRWIHLRELARLTATSPGTLKKELSGLVDAGLLKAQAVGNQTQFAANTDHPVYPELSGLIRKTTGLRDLLAAALQPLSGPVAVVFVFGSVARSTETAQSDVDLMVIGDASFGEVINAIYEAQANLGREINPKVMSRAEWSAKKREQNPFVQELLSKPKLFIVGGEDDL